MLTNSLKKGYRKNKELSITYNPVILESTILSNSSYQKLEDGHSFRFLNLEKRFGNVIDWDYPENGKLWTYNLNYFDYLNQADMDRQTGLQLMSKLLDRISQLQNANEPYTISLRGINWIKFLSKHQVQNREFSESLYFQYELLHRNFEYHLLGNHLLENAFSLWFASFYFSDQRFYKKAKNIIYVELQEQILKDGGHYELSTMYHQIILSRLLDCINLSQNNRSSFIDKEFESRMISGAERMLSWLGQLKFGNQCDGAPVNDSAPGIAPSIDQLVMYAKRLGISTSARFELSDSGYRCKNLTISDKNIKMIIDVGSIGPDYQPGHAHSDTFNFLLSCDGHPIIVETGTSTYENNSRRHLERSTESHNTVKYGNYNQSEVWASFRVARRAKVKIIEESEQRIVAEHNGYNRLGVTHRRSFVFNKDRILIRDEMIGDLREDGQMFIHFDPSIDPILIGNRLKVGEIEMDLQGYTEIRLIDYEIALGFNKLEKAKLLVANFQDISTFSIFFKPDVPSYRNN